MRSTRMVVASLALSSLAFSVACKTGPVEPEPAQKDPVTSNADSKKAEPKAAEPKGEAKPTGLPPGLGAPARGADPMGGSFSLADATKELKGNGPIVAKIETSKGTLQCRLLEDKAPVTVANFIGLATGKRSWKDPSSGQWVNRPAYDGTSFHRIIKGFMIQGGDPRGDGTGEPGYVIKDELWEGAKHDRAGLLCMANRGPNTNGAQFFITDASAPHLDRSYTIFGECAPVEVVHDIANVQTAMADRPTSPVTIKSVTISRDDTKKK